MNNQKSISLATSETQKKQEWQTPELIIVFGKDTKGKMNYSNEITTYWGTQYGPS